MKSTKEQRKQIKIRQKMMGMSESDYRAFLSGWDVGSCTEMSREQAGEAIAALDKQMLSYGICSKGVEFWASAPGSLKTRYDDLLPRDACFATPAQLRYLEKLWVQVTRQKTWVKAMDAFKAFLQNRFHVGDILWVKREDVGKIANVLKVMQDEEVTKLG